MGYEQETRTYYQSKQVARRYRDYHSRGLTWVRLAMSQQKKHVEEALSQCDLSVGDTILDMPCGTGFILDILLETGAFVIGGDISKEMIELAAEDNPSNNFMIGELSVYLWKMKPIPFPDST